MPANTPRPDLVVPVPLHWRRQAERGYNQAEEIASGLCRQLDWRLAAGICQRQRATPAQSQLSAAERRMNLHAAFVVRPLLPDLHVSWWSMMYLTTGATAEALAHTLRAAGVGRLALWTVAHALKSPGSSQASAGIRPDRLKV
jgi:predicted amidophosphoribosyltransferase